MQYDHTYHITKHSVLMTPSKIGKYMRTYVTKEGGLQTWTATMTTMVMLYPAKSFKYLVHGHIVSHDEFMLALNNFFNEE